MSLCDDIKERMTIPQLCSSLNIQGVKPGMNKCIFHTEKTPSLHVRDRVFNCFGCGAKGSVIDFLANFRGYDDRQAIMEIAGLLGMELQRTGRADPIRSVKPSQVAIAKNIIPDRRSTIPSDGFISWALTKGIHRETIARLVDEGSLSFSGDHPIYHYNTGEKERMGFGSSKTTRWRRGSPKGAVWRMRLAGQFNVRTVLILEGESDTMLSQQFIWDHAIPDAVAVGMPNAAEELLPQIASMLGLHRDVVIIPDGDDAGRGGARRNADIIRTVAQTRSVTIVLTPDNEDVCSLGTNFLSKVFDMLREA